MNTQNEGQSNNKQSNLSWSAPAPKAQAPATKPVVSVTTPPSNRTAAKIAGWLAVGVVAGVILAWGGTALLKRSPVATSGGTLQNATSTSGAVADTSGSLVVTNPQKAGTSVAIEKVTVSEPTWVVVYETRDGKPGNVLGAAIFTPDQSSGTVELLRGTFAGQTYLVTEQTDNGDRRFSLKDDPLLLAQDGQPLWVSFTAN